jgi:penicillin-binding protein 1A
MKKALEGKPVLDFVQPENIEWNLINPRTGFLASEKTPGAFLEAFIKGTAPTQQHNQKTTLYDHIKDKT